MSGGAGRGLWPAGGTSLNVGIAIAVTAMAGLALAATIVYSRGSLKSPWSHRRRKHVLLPKQWNNLFKPDGKFIDDGVKFLKKVRSGGVDPSIRAEVWPFLLGVYDINTSKEERNSIRTRKRKEYQNLRRQCRRKLRCSNERFKLKESAGNSINEGSGESSQLIDSPSSVDFNPDTAQGSSHDTYEDSNHVIHDSGIQLSCSDPHVTAIELESSAESDHSILDPTLQSSTDAHDLTLQSSAHSHNLTLQSSAHSHDLTLQFSAHSDQPIHNLTDQSSVDSDRPIHDHTLQSSADSDHHPIRDPNVQSSDTLLEEACEKSGITYENESDDESESSDPYSIEEIEQTDVKGLDDHVAEKDSPSKAENLPKSYTDEDFTTWQRIIRLDAVRANDEWIIYSPSQASVSAIKAHRLAESVGLKDYDHLEPCRIFHAARLVSILEAYAMYDSEIGYCQGMSDLLSPIISTIDKDHEAFWCFVGFMKKARHNFRLDEIGIRRQLSVVSKIIKCKDSHLYKHLEKLQAEDCFFVYRMVVVLFRRELTFEQTLCLWEVMWADQAAIRAGIAKSVWGRIRLKAPPTDDLLLYAIAACVLQKRKLIIEKYNMMEDIMRECNAMAGHLDVWKLLDDAHDLVVNLHDKI